MGRRIYTVGHSTRTLGEFIPLLTGNGVSFLADVRKWPTSRISPWFKGETLEAAIRDVGVGYVWLGESLGGYRPRGLGEASPNRGWRNMSFRNYADYAMTEDFGKGLAKLTSIVEDEVVAVMCAEKMYTSCHRRIISDYLAARGYEVVHIIEAKRLEPHRVTRSAVIADGVVSYPVS